MISPHGFDHVLPPRSLIARFDLEIAAREQCARVRGVAREYFANVLAGPVEIVCDDVEPDPLRQRVVGKLMREGCIQICEGAGKIVLDQSQPGASPQCRRVFCIEFERMIDIARLRTLLQRAQQNLAFHHSILGDVSKAATGGATSIADQQQAQERLIASQVRIEQIRDDLAQAESRFIQLVGLPIGPTGRILSVSAQLPRSIDQILGIARAENPLLKIRNADLDAQLAQVKSAESVFYPRVSAEVSASRGHDVNRVQGQTDEYRGELVARWNIFNGGIDAAAREEQIRRASELRMSVSVAHREVENEVRQSWERRRWLGSQRQMLQRQSQVSQQLLKSYREQFGIGARSLLDLLDTQNTAYATDAALLTAQHAELFSEYRLLASMGRLLKTMRVPPSNATQADNRAQNFVPPTPPSETMPRSKGDPWFEIR